MKILIGRKRTPRHLLIECDAVIERRTRIRTEELSELDPLLTLQFTGQLDLKGIYRTIIRGHNRSL